MKDYDELLKYYEIYETIGTGNCYFFLGREDSQLFESLVCLGRQQAF